MALNNPGNSRIIRVFKGAGQGGSGRWRVAPKAITIGANGEFRFAAAHSGLHGGELEPLHGHTYLVTLTLEGDPDEAEMVCDFADAKEALSQVIAPLKRRTIMPARLPGGTVTTRDGQVIVECGRKHYSLPAEDVVLLPVPNTTTEALAGWLLEQLTAGDWFRLPGIRSAELVLQESPAASGTARARLGGRG
jgi:6-pyruvoyl-tetrahydropterin synthase